MPLSIPMTNHGPSAEEPCTLATYGDPKIGKTETVAKLGEAVPNNLLLVDTHFGARFVQSTRRVQVNSLEEVKELPAALKVAWKAAPFRFLAIDVLDDIETWALEDAEAAYRRMPTAKTFGGQSILELEFGLGYSYLRDAFIKLVSPLFGNDLWTTIFIIHSRIKYQDASIVTDVSSEQLDLTGKVRKMVCKRVDAVGHWLKDANGQLWLDFRTKEKVICGLRARYLHNMAVPFSDPARPEEWARVWPKTWNKPAVEQAVAPETPPTT